MSLDAPKANKAHDGAKNTEYAAVCTSCEFRENAADHIAASLVAEDHRHEEVEVLPVAFDRQAYKDLDASEILTPQDLATTWGDSL